MGGDTRRPPPPPGPSGRILCGRPAYVTFQRTRRLPVAGHPARQNLIVPEDVLLVVLSDTIARPAVGTPACPLTARAVLRRIFALEAALSPDRLLAECGDLAGEWGAPHRRARGTVPALRLTAALECANDVGGRFTLWPSGDAHLPSCLSCSAATSCGSAARQAVAHGRLGPWRERPPGPRAWYGRGAMHVFTRLSPPLGGSLPVD